MSSLNHDHTSNFKQMPEIKTLEDAFRSIEENGWTGNLPVAAIEFLREHPPSDIIDGQISHAIIHANDDAYYWDPETDRDSVAPLYYAIVAEAHLTEKLTKAVIHYATHPEEDDFETLREQLTFLTGNLCEAFPDSAPGRMFDVFERQVKRNMPHPYPILIEALYFFNKKNYSSRLINLLDYSENMGYVTAAYIDTLAEIGLKEALPENSNLSSEDKKQAIIDLKGEPGADENIGPLSRYRGHWKEVYK